MITPTIIICTDAARSTINDYIELEQGRGPNTMSVPLCAIDENATWETPPTHWYTQDMGVTDDVVAEWQQFQAQEMQPGDMMIFTATGFATTVERDAWRDNCYTSQGLMRVPDEPIE